MGGGDDWAGYNRAMQLLGEALVQYETLHPARYRSDQITKALGARVHQGQRYYRRLRAAKRAAGFRVPDKTGS